MDRRAFLAAAGALATAGCSGNGFETVTRTPTRVGTPPAEAIVEVVDSGLEAGSEPGIRGTVANTGERTVGTATVVAALFDMRNDRFAERRAAVTDLAPGSTAEFEIPLSENEGKRTRRYEIRIDPEATRY